LTKYDYDNGNGNNKNNVADGIGGMQKIDAIAKDLQLKDPLLISSKTGSAFKKQIFTSVSRFDLLI
jgi:hypothetical protein